MSGENAAPATEPTAPQAPAPELQPSAPAPADGGATPAPAEANAPEPQPTESVEEQNKKRERFDRRFSDLTQRARDAELRAARAEGEAAALRAMQQRPNEPTPSQAAPAEDRAPDSKDKSKYPLGDYDPRYAVDLAKFEIRQDARREQEASEQREQQAAEERAITEGFTRLETTIERAQELADGENGQYFENAPRFLEQAKRTMPRTAVDLITKSDVAVHIAEVLGRDPKAAAAYAKSEPLDQAAYIGELSARIRTAIAQHQRQPAPTKTRPAPTPSPAPMPVVPHGGAAPSFNPENAPFSEFEAHFARVRGQGA